MLKRLSRNSWRFPSRVCDEVSFLLLVRQTASGLLDFVLHYRFFSALYVIFQQLRLKASMQDCFWNNVLAPGTP